VSRLAAQAGRGAARIKDAAKDLRQSPVVQHAIAARERGNLEAAFWLLNEEFTQRPDDAGVALHYWDVALCLGRVEIASAAGVKLIESRADGLTELMVRKVRESPRMAAYHRFGDDELGERARSVYGNLGKWLEEASEGLVKEEYTRLGKLRCQERIPLSQLIWGLLLTRRTLWEFIELQGWETVSDLQRNLDLEILVVRFFDRAILHAATGYESVGSGPEAHRHPKATPFWPGG